MNRIPKTNSNITILTERDTPFFVAPAIKKTIPIRRINKYHTPMVPPHFKLHCTYKGIQSLLQHLYLKNKNNPFLIEPTKTFTS